MLYSVQCDKVAGEFILSGHTTFLVKDMVTIVVHIASALICFSGNCYNALIGNDTPVGEFSVVHAKTNIKGYGGDVLAFAQDDAGVYAIHRVYTLNVKEQRLQRLKSNDAKQRRITHGCVNVMPEVYTALVDCCSNGSKVQITQ